MTPFFSIIIPVYNGVSMGLPQCLDSIWAQPLGEELYEVIAIDDCSTDNTCDWLHGQERLHPTLRVLENEVNIRQGGQKPRCESRPRTVHPLHRPGRLLPPRLHRQGV